MVSILLRRLPFTILPEERSVVGAVFILHFLFGFSKVFVDSAAYALFIDVYGADNLPFSYLATAVIISSLGISILRIGGRVSQHQFLFGLLIFNLLVTVSLRIAINIPALQFLIFILPAWELGHVNLNNIVIWTMVGSLFNVRQNKRVVGVISAGRWLAMSVGGIMITPIVASVGTQNLFLTGGLLLIPAILLYQYIVRTFPQNTSTTVDIPRQDESSIGLLMRNFYVRSIFFYMIVWVAVYFISGQIFYIEAATQYPDTDQLASFMGLFYALTSALALFINLFLVGPFFKRFGVRLGLLISPILFGLIYLAYTGLTLFETPLTLVFMIAVIGRGVNIASTFSIDITCIRILYQPLTNFMRTMANTAAETIVEPISIGLAGIFLILLSLSEEVNKSALGIGLLAVLLIWIVMSLVLRRQYLGMLLKALTRRYFQAVNMDMSAEANQIILEQGLQSSHPQTAIYAASMLEETATDLLIPHIPTLLNHPDHAVRLHIMDRIQQLQLTQFLPDIEKLIASDEDTLSEKALTIVIALGGITQFHPYQAMLDDGLLHHKRGIMTGLVTLNTPEAIQIVSEQTRLLADATDTESQILFVDILATITTEDYNHHLLRLMQQDHPEIQQKAIMATVNKRDTALWQQVIDYLFTPELRLTAKDALLQGQNLALPAIRETLTRDDLSDHHFQRLIDVCGQFEQSGVDQLLLPFIHDPNLNRQTPVVEQLAIRGYQQPSQNIHEIESVIEREGQLAVDLLTAILDLQSNPNYDLLTNSLTESFQLTRKRILWLLSFIYPVDISVTDAIDDSSTSEKQAYALELLDTILPGTLKSWVLPLMEIKAIQEGESIKTLTTRFLQQHHTPDDWIAEFAQEDYATINRWVHDVATYMLPDEITKDDNMYTVIEKVIFLKTVDLFASTPNAILATIAELLQQVEVPAGGTIFEKGDTGDSMYIVISGKMKAHDNNRFLNYLDVGAVFGEMALLDPEPRLASITAVEDTQLLRLARLPFYELMEERPEIALGIIRVLTRYLRARVKDIVELRDKYGISPTP